MYNYLEVHQKPAGFKKTNLATPFTNASLHWMCAGVDRALAARTNHVNETKFEKIKKFV